jgi:hypothetical protein
MISAQYDAVLSPRTFQAKKDFLMRTLTSYLRGAGCTSLVNQRWIGIAICAACVLPAARPLYAQLPSPDAEVAQPVERALDKAATADPVADEPISKPEPQLKPFPPAPDGAQPLAKKGRAWMNREKQQVIVDARVSLRRGLLEMFACTPNTKEHESIVAVDSAAFVLHAGLLAVGAEPGSPVQFTPEYKAPTGTQINIEVHWIDTDGKQQKAKAQDWIRDARTNKTMDLPWVFAGSGFWRDEETGNSGYLAEAGDLICVANFSTAMLDVPAELTSDNSGLLYEAYTERIPPLGWPVRLVLKPVLEDAKEPVENKSSDQPARQPSPPQP